MVRTPVASVIIPACNEVGVIARCLRPLVGEEAPPLEVIVVCNGCTDGTEELVRVQFPGVSLVEMGSSGKAAALNEGDRVATVYPRIYVDADIELTGASVRAIVEVLRRPGVLCATPRMRVDVSRCGWIVRRFYEVWTSLPYASTAMVGCGLYALSETGKARVGKWPDDLIADDEYVASYFAPEERCDVPGAEFTVRPPIGGWTLLQVRARVYRGNRQLSGGGPNRSRSPLMSLLQAFRTAGPLAVGVYLIVSAAAKARGMMSADSWARDESSRRERPPKATHCVGYVVSRYPSVSHSFVQREVEAVRAAGMEVRTFAVQRAMPSELLSEIDRREAQQTWSVRPARVISILRPHVRLLISSPSAWVKVLVRCVRRSRPGIRGHIWQIYYFIEGVMLWGECRRQGVRHLHAHHANVAADLAWIASDIGACVDGMGTWAWTLTFHGSGELFEVARHNLPLKLRAAVKVLCVSDFTRAQLLGMCERQYWEKFVVVNMGADLARYRPATSSEQMKVATGSLLSVGRIDPVKGQYLLIDAIASIIRRGSECRLRIVGEGPGLDDLRAYIDGQGVSGAVTLLGAVGQDELPALYRSADVFCLASFTEALPVVLMEAMASGLPVVATAVGAVSELVKHGESGLIVRPGRADLLASAIEGLLRDPALRAEMGEVGRKVVVESYDSTACGRIAAEVLRSVRLSIPGDDSVVATTHRAE